MKRRGDLGLWVIAGGLVLFGMVMIYSSSGVLAEQRMGDSAYFLKRQMLWVLLAIPMVWTASQLSYTRWRSWLPLLTAGMFLLLILVLLPTVSREINGSRRWLSLWGLSVQPSELAKLFCVFYVAHHLAKKGERIVHWREGILPPLVMSTWIAALIMVEPDFGTAASLLLIVGALFFLGGIPIRHLATVTLLGLPILLALAVGNAYRRERLLTFLDPWRDPMGDGFQIIQSFLALGGGGALGVGLGEGRQKLFYLPEPHTDFIFAVTGEELGLWGTVLLAGLYLALLVKGFRLAMRTDEPFGRLLASGLTLMVILPALLNMGVVTGLLPTKGLPLPLVSYGGSSLLANLLAVGLLFSISRSPNAGGIARSRDLKRSRGKTLRGKRSSRRWRR